MKKEYLNDCPEYLADYLTYMQLVKGRSERTVEAYYIDLRTFLRYLLIDHSDVDPNKSEFEDIPISEVPFDYVRKIRLIDGYNYLKWLADDRGNSIKTRARKTSALKQFYSYLYVKKGLIGSNPIEQLELPKMPKTLPKYLSLDDAQKLLASIDSANYERDYCMITLFLNCGMRLSELCGLDLEDLSFDNGTLRLFGKGAKERIVYMNNACIEALRAYLPIRNAVQTPEKALFLSNRNTRISKRMTQYIVEQSLKKAGLGNMGITTHKLRHTAATLMYQYGKVDTLVLKDILGHESLATTEIYTHLTSDNMRDAANANPLADQHIKKRGRKNKDGDE
ncbi:tyrosine recombinase XerC [uncultured Ruminococcus sp.]|uniref:tyrosine recombinase XerC n=1 Tax=uncultured Ruminococcus sp. TaxID=165186 RepID=UPI0025CEAE3A|nr:tyrosine recombinase XerC [uncultured Ruminococcus sp.]